MNNRFLGKAKRLLSGVLAATMAVTMLPAIPAMAEDTVEKYPYTLFAGSSEEGAITVNSDNFCVNGNVATNGTITSNGNMNINGTKTENANEDMLYIFDKIDSQYFSSNNIDEHTEDYTLEEMNININTPTEVQGEATLTGNININTAFKALGNVNLYGEVKNTNNSLIYSKYGDIIIDSQNVNLNGLVYAPFGDVEITAQNLNLNNVVIIADSITFNCPSVNANYSNSVAEFAGNISEPLNIPYEEYKYLLDSDGDVLPDIVELQIGTDPYNVDSDGDSLPDGYEALIAYTNPTKLDTDDNAVNDGDEDFDEDGLTNLDEYNLATDPWSSDTDGDGLSDSEEVNTYGTDPLKKDTDDDGLEDGDEIYLKTDPTIQDTDGNGILDCDEKFNQTFTHIVENEDCAVKEVIVSMNGTGNLQNTTTVESVMNKDVICSDVVGLIGEPFSIESESQFDTATITYKIDQSKLGNTAFDSLMFLWYDEENYEFVELETTYNYEESAVSIETTHFSRYMVVDKYKWFEAWSKELNYTSISHEKSICYSVLAVDCSGSMSSNDPITIISPSSAPYQPIYSCERYKAALNFVNAMDYDDKAAIVTFESTATSVCGLTDDTSILSSAVSKFYNGGGTSFDAALRKSIDMLSSSYGGTRKKIILLTDGGSSVSSSIIKEAADSYIKIYTIGLGNSSDTVLQYIADETGGEFFKAYTANELIKIYEDIGISDDFDKTDTDGDELYDAVEVAGIRIQNGNIIYNCDPTKLDTDNDGLNDGQEIDPKIRWKAKYYYPSDVPESAIAKKYYFVMKSNPTESDDTDGDGYSDLSDIDPAIYNDYGFLDDEIYNIGQFNESEYTYKQIEVSSISTSPKIVMNDANKDNSQKFKFKWCGTGYKIYPIDGESTNKVLTINTVGNTHGVIIATDEDKPEQIWEILPRLFDDTYGEYSDGLIIRSKMMDYTTTTGKSLYLTTTSSNTLVVATEREANTRFKLYSPNNWTRFGEAYLNYIGWEYTNISNGMVSFENYYSNINTGLDSSNIETINGKKILINQSGGNFPKLYFNSVKMDGVCCEIMGTYNALTLADEQVDFFKLALEFEYNATLCPVIIGGFTYSGTWGSDPYKIDDCLDAYNVSYTTYDSKKYATYTDACHAFDAALSAGKGSVISYNFSVCGLYLPIHTFAATYDSTNPTATVKTFNRYSNYTSSANYLSIYDEFQAKDAHFLVGYILN